MLIGLFLILMFGSGGLATGEVATYLDFSKPGEYGTIRVEARMDSPPEVVWEVLTDISRWPKWIPSMRRGWVHSSQAVQNIPLNAPKEKSIYEDLHRRFPENGDSQMPAEEHHSWSKVVFEEYDLLWPIQDEWVVKRYLFDSTEGKEHKFRAEWGRIFDGNRMIEGHGDLIPADVENATLFTYQYRVRAKEGVPIFLFKLALKTSIHHMVEAIIKESKNLRGNSL